MRIGILTPVVVQHPGAASPWEAGATVADLRLIAEAADRLGFAHLTCSEHVAIPATVAAERGAVYWDPLATLSFLAAVTSRIRLVTHVLVLGYHHPLEIAKRYGTLDVLSGGRLVLGVGVGSLAEEFELLGASYRDRGARADEALAALRAALGDPAPRFRGTYFEFGEVRVEPSAQQQAVPIWVGGRTRRSLRRALVAGQGWVPFGLPLADVSALLAREPVPDGFEVVLAPGRPLDPISRPDRAAAALDSMAAAGATIANVGLAANSAEHYCDQLEALARMRDQQ